jgi:hypothetical protein
VTQEQKAIQEYLAGGGKVTRCPNHAQSTGQMRFNYATKAQREREERAAAEGMKGVRNGNG